MRPLSVEEEHALLVELVEEHLDGGGSLSVRNLEILGYQQACQNPTLRPADEALFVGVHRHTIPLAWEEGKNKYTGTLSEVLAWAKQKGWLSDDHEKRKWTP